MKKNDSRILIVDDEEDICEILARLIRQEGFQPLMAYDGETALRMLRSEFPEVLLTDFRMPGIDGLEVLKRAKELDPDLPVIIITAYADISGAVEAMRVGAHDYLAKPFEHPEVVRVLYRALAERNLKKKLRKMSRQIDAGCSLSKLMGTSDAIGRVISDVNSVADSDFTVVIQGETGSGKELVARAIHQTSHRSAGPFVAIDCGAIPETLLESELFGYEKGAFTNAVRQQNGKFQMAKGGTLFLDEILNMPWGSQVKLLRVLQEKKVYRLGGSDPADIDVRLLVASNRDLLDAVATESFRRDLFYRMNDFTVKIPPLRERRADIPYLAGRFLDTTNLELSKSIKGFSETAMDALLAFHWPGNVRQLRSTIRRAVLLADDTVTEKHLDMHQISAPLLTGASGAGEVPWQNRPLKEIVRGSILAVERQVLSQALKYTGGNKAKAARMLQIDYKTIHTKVKRLGIQID